MSKDISNLAFVNQARSEKYTGVPYSKLDCQAFVEKVLEDCGVRKPDGSVYNWKGVNSMWRNAFTWKGTIEEAKKVFGCIPLGAWVIHWVNDGGERERGYNDGLGNAKHIGIYTGEPGEVRDSTEIKTGPNKRNGVGYRALSGFNYVCLPFMINYQGTDLAVNQPKQPDKEKALQALEVIKLYILGGK